MPIIGNLIISCLFSNRNGKLPTQIHFVRQYYDYGTFDTVADMLKALAENTPSTGHTYIYSVTYGSIYTAIVQSYTEDTHRAVFGISYAIHDSPIYFVKSNGAWEE